MDIRPIPSPAPLPAPAPAAALAPARREMLMAKAEELEAGFLAEMLAYAGLGETQGSFGGGPGEAQFASFLRQEQARLLVRGGGIGLAQLIFDGMARAETGGGE